jgi:hypothetical protein
LPRYARGPKKGTVKAWLEWKTAEKGGWHRDGNKSGVVHPGLLEAALTSDPNYGEGNTLRAIWMGMEQPLRGPAKYLSEEGRALGIDEKRHEITGRIMDLANEIRQREELVTGLSGNPHVAHLIEPTRDLIRRAQAGMEHATRQLEEFDRVVGHPDLVNKIRS